MVTSLNAKLDWQFDFFFHFFAQQMGPSLASGNLQDTYSLNSPKKSNGLIRFMQSLNNKKSYEETSYVGSSRTASCIFQCQLHKMTK